MKYIFVNDIEIELEKKKIKNMYLRILPPDGKVHVTAPYRMSEAEIKQFILSKIDWIQKQKEKVSNRHTHQVMNYVSGEEVYLWGQRYQLELIYKEGHSSLRLEGNVCILTIKKDTTVEQKKHIVDLWYREVLKQTIPSLMLKWEQKLGVTSSGFTIRDMKTRWGTCNIRTKNICLSLQLAKKHPRCLEYVVVHELVHLLESSHNSVFKGYLDHYLPEWRIIKKEMNGDQIS